MYDYSEDREWRMLVLEKALKIAVEDHNELAQDCWRWTAAFHEEHETAPPPVTMQYYMDKALEELRKEDETTDVQTTDG